MGGRRPEIDTFRSVLLYFSLCVDMYVCRSHRLDNISDITRNYAPESSNICVCFAIFSLIVRRKVRSVEENSKRTLDIHKERQALVSKEEILDGRAELEEGYLNKHLLFSCFHLVFPNCKKVFILGSIAENCGRARGQTRHIVRKSNNERVYCG